MKLCLRNIRLLYDNRELTHGAILVNTDSGTIEKICNDISPKECDVAVEFSRDYIALPGFVDIHVHCRDFEQAYKETIRTCTEAAAAGGVVTIYDMPNTRPRISNYEIAKKRLEKASKESKIEYRLHLGLPDNVEELDKIVKELNINSVKLYPEDIEKLETDTKYSRQFFEKVRELNITIVAHCESIKILRDLEDKYEHSIQNHAKLRPPEAEIASVLKIISLSMEYKIPHIHIAHVSHPDTVDIINMFRKYINITCEVTPHHLLISDSYCMEKFKDNPTICKVNPPLRSEEIRRELLRRFMEGRIDCVASDHAPHALFEKVKSYDECPPGFPGLETTSLLLLDMWRRGILDIVDVVRLYSTNPCKVVKKDPPRIVEGNYADIVVVDIKSKTVVRAEKFRSCAKYSPFEGYEANCSIVMTLYRGNVVYINENYLGKLRGLENISVV